MNAHIRKYGPATMMVLGLTLAIIASIAMTTYSTPTTTTLAPTTTSVAPRAAVIVPSIETLNNLALCVHSAATECHVDVEDGQLVVYGTYPTVAGPQTLRVHCQEDDPCWDCHTMGNRVCGKATP